jgi:hypothetical protein
MIEANLLLDKIRIKVARLKNDASLHLHKYGDHRDKALSDADMLVLVKLLKLADDCMGGALNIVGD